MENDNKNINTNEEEKEDKDRHEEILELLGLEPFSGPQ